MQGLFLHNIGFALHVVTNLGYPKCIVSFYLILYLEVYTMKFKLYMLSIVLCSASFGFTPSENKNFHIKEISDNKIKLSFEAMSNDVISKLSSETISEYVLSAGFLALENGVDYSVDYSVLSYEVIENFYPKETILCNWCYLWDECSAKIPPNPAKKAY